MKFCIFIIAVCLLSINISCQTTDKNMDLTTIKDFDLERYLGKWYEIARFDHKFERGLVGVTATYSMREDGKIRVINQGFKGTPDGKRSVAEGKAKTTKEPGKLRVSFFWIFYADYLILELDDDYQWALIGSSSDKYLWILSRTPKLEDTITKNILDRAKSRGYDTSGLIWVE